MKVYKYVKELVTTQAQQQKVKCAEGLHLKLVDAHIRIQFKDFLAKSKYCLMTSCPAGMYEWCGEDFDRCGQLFEKSFCSIRDGAYKCTCLAGVEEELDENGRFITCIGTYFFV